ncbi:hypothetical protein [Sphingomonas sp.]|uniref:hypothetical protein n=1 Tax=Sphingomonas sp. TaxID=28214 RepID=UPI002B92B952|nr:hypothetical protein [Sphingomonas sp.]HWK36718.1 hypothetical protein [Sphingomonas sp.]
MWLIALFAGFVPGLVQPDVKPDAPPPATTLPPHLICGGADSTASCPTLLPGYGKDGSAITMLTGVLRSSPRQVAHDL